MNLEEYEKEISEWCDKLEKLIQEVERLRKANQDTNAVVSRLKTTLDDYDLFKRKYRN